MKLDEKFKIHFLSYFNFKTKKYLENFRSIKIKNHD
jgi:hypothetical protein